MKPIKGTYWMINTRGGVEKAAKAAKKYDARRKFGNCFKSEKVAKEAKKRVQALFRRLKGGIL